MRRLFGPIIIVARLTLASAAADAPSVGVIAGDAVFVDAAGAHHPLTTGGGFKEPALAPDGHTVAFIHVDGQPQAACETGPTSLWIADGLRGGARKLIGHHDASDVKQVFVCYGGPVFRSTAASSTSPPKPWATSGAVHQISLATGHERLIIDGGGDKLVRTGLARLSAGHAGHVSFGIAGGSYDPTYVVGPDAKQSFIVPGTDRNDDKDHVTLWLKQHDWAAW